MIILIDVKTSTTYLTSSKLPEFAHLYKNVGTEDDLKGIVPDEESLDVERLAIFHVIWTQNFYYVDVGGTEQDCRPGAGHHDPAISSRIKSRQI